MLRRKAYDQLTEWKNRPHKCLVIQGQRQVGKSFIIREFAKANYEHQIYLDFNEKPELGRYFSGDHSVDGILNKMSLDMDSTQFVPGSTVIILDEVQECPEARTSLKYFTQDGRFDVIASGSLLGVRTKKTGNEEHSLPVGYEEHLQMYSLDFEEFLWALNIPEESIEMLRTHIHLKKPLGEFYHDRFSKLFRDFMIIGGMPESVQRYVDTKMYSECDRIFTDLEGTIHRDITKYCSGLDGLKTSDCYDSIPAQLAETNKRFKYSRLEGSGRKARDRYDENLLWIRDAGYGNFCYCLMDLQQPIAFKEIRDNFKVYQSDTGMLTHRYGKECMRAIYDGDASFNLGAITENIVAECLVKGGYPARYFRINKGERKMELDFVVSMGKDIVAIEVKSGKCRDSPSLSKVNKFFDVRRIMLESGDIHVDGDGIEHYPLYAAAFMHSMEPDEDGPRFVHRP